MSDSNRHELGPTVVLIVAATFLLLMWSGFVWYVSAQNTYQTVAGQERAERYNAERQGQECGRLWFLFDQCAPGQPQTKDDGATAEYDLAAQNKMADWSAVMVLVSAFGVIVTGAGVVYVALTLNEAKNTTAAAVAAAKAATDSNVILRDDQRPWLSIANPDLFDVGEANVEQNSPPEIATRDFLGSIRFEVRNSGRFPARNAQVHKFQVQRFTHVGDMEALKGVPDVEVAQIDDIWYADLGGQVLVDDLLKRGIGRSQHGSLTIAPNDRAILEEGSCFFHVGKENWLNHRQRWALVVFVTYSGQSDEDRFATYVIYDYALHGDGRTDDNMTMWQLERGARFVVRQRLGDMK